jgi:hypothetical protein
MTELEKNEDKMATPWASYIQLQNKKLIWGISVNYQHFIERHKQTFAYTF